MILYNILGWIFLIALFITFILLSIWVFSGFNNKTRFTPVPVSFLREIEKALNIKDDNVIYHLGCGDGRVLFYLSKKNSKAKYIGIEDNTFLSVLARLRNRWDNLKRRNKIEIIDKDFFEQDLSKATHIFTYLYPNTMDDILPKLDKELSRGVRLISLNFKFTSKKPIFEIGLKRRKFKHKNIIYVYEF